MSKKKKMRKKKKAVEPKYKSPESYHGFGIQIIKETYRNSRKTCFTMILGFMPGMSAIRLYTATRRKDLPFTLKQGRQLLGCLPTSFTKELRCQFLTTIWLACLSTVGRDRIEQYVAGKKQIELKAQVSRAREMAMLLDVYNETLPSEKEPR